MKANIEFTEKESEILTSTALEFLETTLSNKPDDLKVCYKNFKELSHKAYEKIKNLGDTDENLFKFIAIGIIEGEILSRIDKSAIGIHNTLSNIKLD